MRRIRVGGLRQGAVLNAPLHVICSLTISILLVFSPLVHSVEEDDAGPALAESNEAELEQREQDVLNNEMIGNEDPDAVRRIERQSVDEDEPVDSGASRWESEIYGSVRLHAINYYEPDSDTTDQQFGDGASRLGVTGEWRMSDNWNLFGRVEMGFDAIDTFTAKAQNDDSGDLHARLYHIAVESDFLFLKVGKSWSTYYTVAGAADRFSIFGGSAMGVYNASTDGGATGTGRADEAIQTRFYIDTANLLTVKPFNLNLQYQPGQSIPHVHGKDYDYSWSASAWLESENELGIGLAYHRAYLDEYDPEIRAAGIDGTARARAIAFKKVGHRWLASLALSDLENIETTDQNLYISGTGAELFIQWQAWDNIWLIGGGNWLKPDDDDPEAGKYEVKYGVLGIRYTLDSMRRVVYAEFKNDHGRLTNGAYGKNEFTVGVRWDFGY